MGYLPIFLRKYLLAIGKLLVVVCIFQRDVLARTLDSTNEESRDDLFVKLPGVETNYSECYALAFGMYSWAGNMAIPACKAIVNEHKPSCDSEALLQKSFSDQLTKLKEIRDSFSKNCGAEDFSKSSPCINSFVTKVKNNLLPKIKGNDDLAIRKGLASFFFQKIDFEKIEPSCLPSCEMKEPEEIQVCCPDPNEYEISANIDITVEEAEAEIAAAEGDHTSTEEMKASFDKVKNEGLQSVLAEMDDPTKTADEIKIEFYSSKEWTKLKEWRNKLISELRLGAERSFEDINNCNNLLPYYNSLQKNEGLKLYHKTYSNEFSEADTVNREEIIKTLFDCKIENIEDAEFERCIKPYREKMGAYLEQVVNASIISKADLLMLYMLNECPNFFFLNDILKQYKNVTWKAFENNTNPTWFQHNMQTIWNSVYRKGYETAKWRELDTSSEGMEKYFEEVSKDGLKAANEYIESKKGTPEYEEVKRRRYSFSERWDRSVLNRVNYPCKCNETSSKNEAVRNLMLYRQVISGQNLESFNGCGTHAAFMKAKKELFLQQGIQEEDLLLLYAFKTYPEYFFLGCEPVKFTKEEADALWEFQTGMEIFSPIFTGDGRYGWLPLSKAPSWISLGMDSYEDWMYTDFHAVLAQNKDKMSMVPVYHSLWLATDALLSFSSNVDGTKTTGGEKALAAAKFFFYSIMTIAEADFISLHGVVKARNAITEAVTYAKTARAISIMKTADAIKGLELPDEVAKIAFRYYAGKIEVKTVGQLAEEIAKLNIEGKKALVYAKSIVGVGERSIIADPVNYGININKLQKVMGNGEYLAVEGGPIGHGRLYVKYDNQIHAFNVPGPFKELKYEAYKNNAFIFKTLRGKKTLKSGGALKAHYVAWGKIRIDEGTGTSQPFEEFIKMLKEPGGTKISGFGGCQAGMDYCLERFGNLEGLKKIPFTHYGAIKAIVDLDRTATYYAVTDLGMHRIMLKLPSYPKELLAYASKLTVGWAVTPSLYIGSIIAGMPLLNYALKPRAPVIVEDGRGDLVLKEMDKMLELYGVSGADRFRCVDDQAEIERMESIFDDDTSML